MSSMQKLFVPDYSAHNVVYVHIYFMQLVLSCCVPDNDTILYTTVNETIIQHIQSMCGYVVTNLLQHCTMLSQL